MICDAFGIPIYAPLDIYGIGHTIASYGYRELDQLYILQQIVRPGMAIIEAGANIGFHIPIYAALTAGNLRVWAVEPDARNLKALNENITLCNMQSRVVVENCALSDFDGMTDLYQAFATNLSALQPSAVNVRYTSVASCKVRDFGKYLSVIGTSIDLVRMDIEGHEINVLRSLVRSSEAYDNPVLPRGILFECHQWAYSSQNSINRMIGILEKLFNLGYSPRFVATAHEDFSPIRSLGLLPDIVIRTSPRRCHGIYSNLPKEIAAKLISTEPSITRVYLHRENLSYKHEQ